MPEAHSSTAIDQHPPKPRLVLRVGVTGHRGEHLKEYDVVAIRTSVAKVLTTIRDVVGRIHQDERAMFVAAPPLLRVLSRLADGAALIVAEEAVQQGFELQCALPFPRDEYANYIDPGWRPIYDRMLAATSTVLELDLDRQQPEEAFLHGRRMVLHHTDLLIAIWDPKRPRKEWGTSRILDEAGRDDILTVHVPPTAPEDAHLDIRGASRKICSVSFTELEARLRHLLCPPRPNPPPNRCERLRRFFDPPLTQENYFAEHQREWRPGFVWKFFCDAVGTLKPSWPLLVQHDVLEQTRQDWKEQWAAEPTIPEPVRRQADHFLRDHFVWADTLADYYADLTRSSFVLNPLMTAGAVACALAGYALGWTAEEHSLYGRAWIWIAAEFGLILAIVALTLFGNRRDWHDRWVDYRLLAEHLRLLRYLLPLGRVAQGIRLPAHLAFGDARGSWVYWCFRAINREAGLVNAKIELTYVQACRALMMRMLGDQRSGQVPYHEASARRFHTIDRRLHWAALVLFLATGAACAAHLWFHSSWLTFVAAVFPAVGGGLAAIRTHAELDRVAKRSQSVQERLTQLADELEKLPALSQAMAPTFEEIAECIISEVLEWRSLFVGGGVPWPG